MEVHSAGVLPFRIASDGVTEVFIAHMGGPFWERKDHGAWSLVKGEFEPGTEDSQEVAKREFLEEIGMPAPPGEWFNLGDFKQPSGKVVTAFVVEARGAIHFIRSNTFQMEWPKGSGLIAEFPEIDRATWFTVEEARTKLLKGQLAILDRLMSWLREARPNLVEQRESTLF